MDRPDHTRDEPASGLARPSPWAAARAAHPRPMRLRIVINRRRAIGMGLVCVGLTGLIVNLGGVRPVGADARVHQIVVHQATPVLAHDGGLVVPQWTVRWRLVEPHDAGLPADPEAVVRLAAGAAVDAAIAEAGSADAPGPGGPLLDSVAARRAQALLDAPRSGIVIDGLAITRLDPPAPLAPAMATLARARAAADAEREAARGWSEALITRARGDAEAFDRVYAQYRRAPAITRRQMYYATMERVLQQGHTVILAAPNARLQLTDPGAQRRDR